MDGKRPSHKDHAEASFLRPLKRQKSSQDDWGNGIPKSQNTLPTSHDQYTIAWICALHIEMAAAHAMLDEIHETLPTHADDSNAYILGNIKQHNVVVACLPEGRYGLNNAANVLTHLVRTFPSIRAGLMVGIGGGVPSKADIRLGDIVVGTRVTQYDLGKIVGDGQMQHTAIPKIPQQLLGTAVTSLRARHEREGSRIPSILREKFEEHSEYRRPASPDCLFLSTYDHVSQTSACDECDHSKLVRRHIRETDDPLIHYGAIASGNKVMRSGTQRDRIARHLDVICFEMEAAGLMDILPCLPIRGICDYSDSHKNKGWQRYAAATAASYARELLMVLPVAEARVKAIYMPNPYRDIWNGSSGQGNLNFQGSVSITTNSVQTNNDEARHCQRDLFVTDPSEDREELKRKKGDRSSGTCKWILDTEELTAWLGSGQATGEDQATHVLWLHGNPGTGKSTMAIFLTEELSTTSFAKGEKTLAYFFCDSGFEDRKTATSVVRGLLFQLVHEHPQLLNYVLPKYNERGRELFKSFDALWAIFMDVVADKETGRKYCIIDALDECDRESQDILLRQLRKTFQSLDATPNIRILITSRPYPEIRKHLKKFTNKDLTSFPEAKQDIDRCIEERLADLADRQEYTDKVISQVRNILRDKADGTFLWVGLACKELENIPSKEAVEVLQRMPKDLHSLYKKLLDTALEHRGLAHQVQVQRILSFVAVCLRPLTVLELSEACQLHQNEEDLETRIQFTREQIESCRLMVIIQDEKVLLLHQSVKDFLARAGAGRFINELKTHADLAYRCVDLLINEYREKKQPRMYFLEYASRYWPNHAGMAQSRFEVKAPQAEFFEIVSPCREYWLRLFRCHKRFLPSIPQLFSILHVAAQWEIPTIADYVSCSYAQRHNAEGLIRFVNRKNASGQTPLECAAKSGHLSMVSKLLDLGGKITPGVTQIAASSSNNGKEVIALLLDRRGDEVAITEKVVKSAAANYSHGKEVIELLLDRRGDQIAITEEVVKAAAGNSGNGKEVIVLLLNRRGDHITITEEVVSIISREFGKEVMKLLLDRRGDKVTITQKVVKAAAANYRHGKEVMTLLLDRRGDQIAITEEVVSTISRQFDMEVMALLLDRRGDKVTITEEVVKAAAANYRHGKEVMTLLLDRRGDEVTITEEVVKAAAGNSGTGQEVMTLLLDRRGEEVTITEEVVKAAAGNSGTGQEVMTLLLDRRGEEVTITEEVVKAAAANYSHGKEVMTLLLNRRGDQITITEEVVSIISREFGKEVMKLLLDRRGDKVTITQKVVKAAAANYRHGKEVMTLLLDRRGDQITITEKLVVAISGRFSKEVVALLLDRRGDEVVITEEVVKAVMESEYRTDVSMLLVDRRKIPISALPGFEQLTPTLSRWGNCPWYYVRK
ncbi:Pfs, NACHT, and ankyrin domain protein [Fusarium sp. MPI-SDFR-AT-0072]|nr:Pfs, NACHT, and ankyrin domain protein [Fusarium sp. MPI-SDFR-AT-0072]